MVWQLQRKTPAQLLLVHHDPTERLLIADCLRKTAGASVHSTSIISEGTQLITDRRFDLALIGVTLPDLAGLELASVAAGRDTPVLLLSDDSGSTERARGLGYSCLEKPIDIDRIVAELATVVQRKRSLVHGVAASAEKMDFLMRSLTAEIAEAHRVFDLIMARLGRKSD